MKTFLVLGLALLVSGCIESPGEGASNPGPASDMSEMVSDTGLDGARNPGFDVSVADTSMSDASMPPDASMSPDAAMPPNPLGRVAEDLEFYFAFRELQTLDRVADLSPNQLNLQIAANGGFFPERTEISLTGTQTQPHSIDVPDGVWDAVVQENAFTLEMFVRVNYQPIMEAPLVAIGDDFVLEKRAPNVHHRSLTLRTSNVSFSISPAMSGAMAHLVLTFDGTTARVYVDGFLVHSQFSELPTLDGTVEIGGPGTVGAVSLVAGYSRALSHPEIVRHFTIGPDPSEAQDNGAPRVEFIRSYRNNEFSDNVTGRQYFATIDEANPDGNVSRLAPRLNQNALLKFDVDVDQLPPERTSLSAYFLFETGYFGNESEAWTLDIHRMTTGWSEAAVSWNQPLEGSTWNAPGANDDFVQEPLFSYESTTPDNQPIKLVIPVEKLWPVWLQNQDHGLIFLSSADQGRFYDPNEPAIHLRPGMMLYGTSTLLPAEPEAVSASTNEVGDSISVTWSSGAVPASSWHEVYQDGVLVGVTSLSNFPVEGDVAQDYQVVVVDAYGRYAYPTIF